MYVLGQCNEGCYTSHERFHYHTKGLNLEFFILHLEYLLEIPRAKNFHKQTKGQNENKNVHISLYLFSFSIAMISLSLFSFSFISFLFVSLYFSYFLSCSYFFFNLTWSSFVSLGESGASLILCPSCTK